jgi:uncharacterized protein
MRIRMALATCILAASPRLAAGDDEGRDVSQIRGKITHSTGQSDDLNLEVVRSRGAAAGGPRTISVSGTGRISAAPDVAEVSVGVVTREKSAREALRSNTKAMEALLAVLKERGVAAKDVQTSNISVVSKYSRPPTQPPPADFVPKPIGYEVTNEVQVTVRDVSKLGVLLDAVVESGANRLSGISFRVDRPERLLDEARKRAMAEARRKAELLAGEAGLVVGRAIRIEEPEGEARLPHFNEAEMSAPVPVAAGEQELSVSVGVVYELRAPK